MRHERHAPDSPWEWLNRAGSDLVIARSRLEGAYLEDLCYHAQQAAEKAMKAVLLHRRGTFPYIHDLAELVNQLRQSGLEVPAAVIEAVTLTEFAVAGRYPGFDEPLSIDQWQHAVTKAEKTLEWARKSIPGADLASET